MVRFAWGNPGRDTRRKRNIHGDPSWDQKPEPDQTRARPDQKPDWTSLEARAADHTRPDQMLEPDWTRPKPDTKNMNDNHR